MLRTAVPAEAGSLREGTGYQMTWYTVHGKVLHEYGFRP